MKKISLKTVKNSMKREEMRNVKGGSGGGYCIIGYLPGCYTYRIEITTDGWRCCY